MPAPSIVASSDDPPHISAIARSPLVIAATAGPRATSRMSFESLSSFQVSTNLTHDERNDAGVLTIIWSLLGSCVNPASQARAAENRRDDPPLPPDPMLAWSLRFRSYGYGANRASTSTTLTDPFISERNLSSGAPSDNPISTGENARPGVFQRISSMFSHRSANGSSSTAIDPRRRGSRWFNSCFRPDRLVGN